MSQVYLLLLPYFGRIKQRNDALRSKNKSKDEEIMGDAHKYYKQVLCKESYVTGNYIIQLKIILLIAVEKEAGKSAITVIFFPVGS